jgi:hypothetical protein
VTKVACGRRGIRAARGGKWSVVQVMRLLEIIHNPFDAQAPPPEPRPWPETKGAEPLIKETPISCVVEGVTLAGTWSVADGMVTVRTGFGSKTAQLGNSLPETLALIMLRGLYEDMQRGFSSTRPERPVG